MEEATKEIWNRHSSKLPVTKDLPRLAKLVAVYAHDQVGRLYPPSDSAIDAMKNLFVELAKRIEKSEALANDIGSEFSTYFADTKQPLDLSTKLFFEKVLGEEETSKIHRLLKFCNQSIIAPAVKKLKVEVLTIANFTKDLGWEIEIEILEDKVIASHIRKEMCLQGNFTYSWKLSLEFDMNITQCQTVSLSVVKLNFKNGVATQKRDEVTRLLQPLLDPIEQLVEHAGTSSVLDFSHLNLSTLPRPIFGTSSFDVCYLHCNKLTNLPPPAGSFANITTLWLSSNSLNQFPPALLELKQLRDLRLNDNQISALPNDMKSLATLKELHLQNNLITIVSESTLCTLPSLVLLNLRQNPLEQFSPKSCQTLEIVYLEDTPLYSMMEERLEKEIGYQIRTTSSSERLANPRLQVNPPQSQPMSVGNSVLLSPRFGKKKPRSLVSNRLSMSITSSISLTEVSERRLSFSNSMIPNQSESAGELSGTPRSGSLLLGTLILDNVSYSDVGKKYTQYLLKSESGRQTIICCMQDVYLANHLLCATKSPSTSPELWVGDKTGKLLTWALSTTKAILLSVLDAHNGPVRALVRVDDMIWTSGDDNTVNIWSAATDTKIKTLNPGVPIGCLIRSGNAVIGGSSSGDIVLWDLLGLQKSSFNIGKPVTALFVETDSDLLWIGSENNILVNNSLEAKDIVCRVEALDSPVKHLLVNRSQNDVTEVWCSTRENTYVFEWNKESNTLVESRKLSSSELGLPVHIFARTDEFLFLAAGQSICVCDPKTEKTLAILKGTHSNKITNIVVVDQASIWTIAEKRQICIWRLTDIHPYS